MGERRGTKGLELWCRRMTEGYPGVNVVNMTTSWRDGLAFCAIIHHFRPDLIEFSKLNKDDVYHNNELAFRIAERHLGIPALLESEDMVEFAVPDRLSILTYLSQFYKVFGVRQGNSPARIAPKRAATTPDHGIVSPASTSPPTKAAFAGIGKVRREPCAQCNHPVSIAERLNVGKLLYHRTCFRCARCTSQLTLANYYETESKQFCCETCPDEEVKRRENDAAAAVFTRSLSDEEKLQRNDESDAYSAKFESALEASVCRPLPQFSASARRFMTSDFDAQPISTYSAFSRDVAGDSGFPNSHGLDDVNNPNSDSLTNRSSLVSCGDEKVNSHIVTKDDANASKGLSLVKERMMLFEKSKSDDALTSVPSIELVRRSSELKLKNIRNEPLYDNTNEKEEIRDDSVIIISDEDSSIIADISLDKEKIKSDRSLENIQFVKEEVIQSNDANVLEDTSKSVIREEVSSVSEEVKQKSEIPKTFEDVSFEENEECVEDIVAMAPIPAQRRKPVLTTPEKRVSGVYVRRETSINPFEDCNEKNLPKPMQRRKLNLTTQEVSGNKSINPFEEEEDEDKVKPQVAQRRAKPEAISLNPFSSGEDEGSDEEKAIESKNPFGDDEDSENDEKQQPTTQRRLLKAPRISLTPWDELNNSKSPNAKSTSGFDSMKPPDSGLATCNSSLYGSCNSLSSAHGGRKKKPAPRPPSGPNSLTNSPSPSVPASPRSTPKFRKHRKAPPPPTSTPSSSSTCPSLRINLTREFEQEKQTKNAANIKIQDNVGAAALVSPTLSENSVPNKSTFGQWKRRKGQAPARPIPQRRPIKELPIAEIKRELETIEIQQLGLEKQGVRLEEIIRERCEGPNADPNQGFDDDVEDLILQLFELVNEKNELFRKQAELMYLRRQQRLEEEHAEVEYEIRCLMLQPEANKTDTDKAREEKLIERLVDIVERRNEIVHCLDMDRLREAEEDDSISSHINLYTLKKDEDQAASTNSLSKKEKKKHKKEKQKNKNKGKGVDADKDVDTCDVVAGKVLKEKKKKKFNIF